MSAPILATKFYIPPPRPKVVSRLRLVEMMNEGLHHKLTLISAAAGFGKTTLVSEWVAQCQRPVAWLSLDEGDNDPTRFLAYFIAALQTIVPHIGVGVLRVLQSPQPPSPEAVLTMLLNEITAVTENFILVLDDYHVIDAPAVDQALTFLLAYQPPQMHLVIATREDPPLPLARLRGRGQLTELRASDLRFNAVEATSFLNQVMGLNLSVADIATLGTRTEGWIAGLQLAAISMQGQPDSASFIQSFTGSHRFVLDYLVEEVLQQQSESVQSFLLRTSILDRLCGPLCDAVLLESELSGQETLAYLEQANLFIVPLDDERRWYRYHHLFGELLRQRRQQYGAEKMHVAELHGRASIWFEENGLEIEAFQQAAAANDVERAARLVEGGGMPLLFRGAVLPVLNWLKSLPTAVLDAYPALWVMYASALLFVSQPDGVEAKLQAAEAVVSDNDPDPKTRDLIGHIAAIRATLAVIYNELETIIVQSQRALAYLHPDNLPVRTATTWTLGVAYQLQGDRAAASQAYSEAIAISEAIGHFIITVMATIGLGNIQEADNQFRLAVETYQRVLKLVGQPPLLVASEAHLGLARINYQWNNLAAAQDHGQQSVQLARQLASSDRFAASELFLVRLKLAQRDVAGAATLLAQTEQSIRQHNFTALLPEVTAVQICIYLHQGKLADAAQLAKAHDLPLSRARVHLAQGESSAALAVLESFRGQVESQGWADERLKALVLQAVAYFVGGEVDTAVAHLNNALTLAEPANFIRLFVDEGQPMADLLTDMKNKDGRLNTYIQKLLAVFAEQERMSLSDAHSQALVEPLSERELEVLQLIAQGLSNREISERLFLAIDTVKGHNRKLFGKLGVQRRTEAVAHARELGLL